jgi:2-keto-4-pentenoate hydratase/2-oxohepta-3-ene-1,7-dioic acid hydratase in catechol pathway
MKYCKFDSENGPRFGQVEELAGESWITSLIHFWESEDSADTKMSPLKLSEAQLLAPVAPSKIICVGRNYRDHAKELGNEVPAEPLLFFKPPSSLLDPGGTIRLPRLSERVDFECELAVVIGKRARNLKPGDNIREYIHGFTIANDVTARDLQKKDGQWTRAKGFDTFCPVGPIIDTDFSLDTPYTLETHVNGEQRQHGSTADFIFGLPELLVYITAAMTLEPGDLLLTGTPAGVGPLSDGDIVEVSIPGLGVLRNPVEADAK